MSTRGLVTALLLAACNQSSGRYVSARDAGAQDLRTPPDGANTDDGGATMSCLPDEADQTGCSCTAGTMRPCYPSSADPATRNVGSCKDGTQSCDGTSEFDSYGACTGAVTPVPESCTDGIDNNCDGKTDCLDPTCATDAACNTGCTDGQTRPCYDGPSGTEGVGTCHDGSQTCTNGMWPSSCAGEVTPTQENCSDALDHNCNYLPGCLDLFACLSSPACQQMCTMPLDAGCVCPSGSGDTATCPAGYIGVDKGGSLLVPDEECCPCTSSTCDNPACCAEPACAGASQCQGLTCAPLPASCNGMVNADCDDFPEDCDEPCCPCRMCSSS